MTNHPKSPVTGTRPKRANLGWALQGLCLLLFAAGFLAEQAGWLRFEASWMYGALLAVMGAAWVVEGMIDRRLSRMKGTEQSGAAPNGDTTTQPSDSGGTDGLPSVS